jgi:predicted GNAT family acetyltransferase
MSLEIKHNESDNKFYTIVDGFESYLRYLIVENNIMDFIKTYVPDELRNRGIAGEIVLKGLKYAEEKKFKIIPSCSYVATFIKRHKNFEHLIA